MRSAAWTVAPLARTAPTRGSVRFTATSRRCGQGFARRWATPGRGCCSGSESVHLAPDRRAVRPRKQPGPPSAAFPRSGPARRPRQASRVRRGTAAMTRSPTDCGHRPREVRRLRRVRVVVRGGGNRTRGRQGPTGFRRLLRRARRSASAIVRGRRSPSSSGRRTLSTRNSPGSTWPTSGTPPAASDPGTAGQAGSGTPATFGCPGSAAQSFQLDVLNPAAPGATVGLPNRVLSTAGQASSGTQCRNIRPVGLGALADPTPTGAARLHRSCARPMCFWWPTACRSLGRFPSAVLRATGA